MTAAARDRRTELYEAYLDVPEHKHAEIVNGTLYVMSRPAPRHADIATALSIEIGAPFRRGRGGPGGWWILFEPEIHFAPKEPVVPDLAGWRVERMPELPDAAFFSVVPDWVCEVLSRSTEKLDREEKLPLYAKHGVRHVWLVDPIAKTIETYTLDEDGERWREVQVHDRVASVRLAPFDAIEIDFETLWSPPRHNG